MPYFMEGDTASFLTFHRPGCRVRIGPLRALVSQPQEAGVQYPVKPCHCLAGLRRGPQEALYPAIQRVLKAHAISDVSTVFFFKRAGCAGWLPTEMPPISCVGISGS
jgi:hypothetical protein